MGQLENKKDSSSGATAKKVLLVTTELAAGQSSALLKDLETLRPDIHVEFLDKRPFDELPPGILENTRYLLGFSNFPAPEQVPNLEWVQLFSAGVNHMLNHPLWKWKVDEVKWCNASGVGGIIIGEYVVLAILAHLHRYLSGIESFQGTGHWPKAWPHLPEQRELYGQTVGIVGYGAIGRNIANLLTRFNVNIITLNSTVKKTPEDRRGREEYTPAGTGDIPGDIPSKWYSSNEPEEKHEFFHQSDVVVVTAPYTPATKHLVDAKALKAMKDTALIVNIARGELIDQDALVKALQKNEIGGAALDVFTPEPYPDDGAFLTEFNGSEWRDKVLLTPHVSGHSNRYNERVLEITEKNLERLEKGQTLLNLLDRRKGY
jgi:phosphoglycerate dehydrogenase-like enzyme